MSHNQDDTLIRMVNQIATNLSGASDEDQVVQGIRRHLESFWARSMKQRLVACLDRDDTELSPLAQRAVVELAGRYRNGAQDSAQ
ncbi:formate dehydrogenase subunit delta [Halomonas binhaiensis]|uniref:Formate dehydrogenase subunit delta n=1 Tax=Halomonas binhaiensis TaxID=2562282 RepID=A0A5C1NHB7_9GAMM|nr:formate dehydrogenase subunit delta [Halomonas binhaiensis]QEM82310.1 formate dehydrogenase subunit delta [Halomonas binhaiensis]